MRRTLVSVLACAAVLIGATPASAGTLNVPNFCLWSVQQNTYLAQDIDLAGTVTPNPAAPGAGIALTGAAIHSRFPDWLEQYAQLFLKPGVNELPTKVWVAVAGDNTVQGVQVLALETVARTTVTENADGSYSMTPLDVTVALPDTTWTAGPGGTVGFRQGSAGSLPPVPGGRGGAMVTPKGSVLISTTTPNGVLLNIDCQPGKAAADQLSGTPALPGPFESVAIQAGAPAPIPAPKVVPTVALRTTALKAKGRSVKVALSCSAADCKGDVTLKAGSKSLGAKKAYTVKSGAKKTVKLTLTKAAQASLKKKKSLKVTLRVTATGGKTLTKRFTLR